MANGKNRCNTINSIIVDNVEFFVQRDLNIAFTNYYQYIFGRKLKRRIKANWNELYLLESRIDLSDLDSPFSEDEIWKAVSDMPSHKVPRLDGFPILFYKTFWNVLKSDLVFMFSDFYRGNLQIGRFNYANVILLHKRVGLII